MEIDHISFRVELMRLYCLLFLNANLVFWGPAYCSNNLFNDCENISKQCDCPTSVKSVIAKIPSLSWWIVWDFMVKAILWIWEKDKLISVMVLFNSSLQTFGNHADTTMSESQNMLKRLGSLPTT